MSIKGNIEKINGIAVECFLPETKIYEIPLLFVHGSSEGSWIWSNFFQYFSSRGWMCYALNLRGHYLSQPVDDWGKVGVAAYLDDLDTVVKYLDKGLVLIGHSMGGVLVQKYAESFTPHKMILLHSAPPKEVVQQIDFNAFMKQGEKQGRIKGEKVLQSDSDPKKMLGYLFDKGNVDQEVLEMAHKKLGKESLRALQEMKDVEVDAEKIGCPVYVIGFNLKKIGLNYPINLSEELSRYYNARDYRVIEPGGHLFMLEKNWDEFAAQIEQWLQE